jgi:hypothetical protein
VTVFFLILIISLNAFASEEPTVPLASSPESVASAVKPQELECTDSKEWRCKSTGQKVAIIAVAPVVIPVLVVVEGVKLFFSVFGTSSGDLISTVAVGR